MGVSAGAVNAVHLASHPGPFASSVADLVDLWRRLTLESIFRVDAPALGQNVLRWGTRLLSGGSRGTVKSLLDTAPLRRLLQDHFATEDGLLLGIGENIRRGVSGSAINARKTHCVHGHPFNAARAVPEIEKVRKGSRLPRGAAIAIRFPDDDQPVAVRNGNGPHEDGVDE